MAAILSKNFPIPLAKIDELSPKWKIVLFAVFGSVLRQDFNLNSYIDCLVKFFHDAQKNELNAIKKLNLRSLQHSKI